MFPGKKLTAIIEQLMSVWMSMTCGFGAGGFGDLKSGSSCWSYPWYWTTIRSIIIDSQEEFWRATSKYLGHCGSGWHPYLPIVVMGHPKRPCPDLGRPSSPQHWMMENPPALNLHFEGVFLHILWCSHVFFSFPHPHLEGIFPWRHPFIGDVPMLFIWFSHDFPIFPHDFHRISPAMELILRRPWRSWHGRAMPSGVAHNSWGRWVWRGKSSKPNWKWPFIVDFPIDSMVMFHIYWVTPIFPISLWFMVRK